MFTIITVQNIRVSLLVLFTHCFCSPCFISLMNNTMEPTLLYIPIHTHILLISSINIYSTKTKSTRKSNKINMLIIFSFPFLHFQSTNSFNWNLLIESIHTIVLPFSIYLLNFAIFTGIAALSILSLMSNHF